MKLSRGVVYVIAAGLGFSTMSVLVKLASARLPTGEIVLARAVVTLIVSFVMVRRAGLSPWGTNRPALVLRGLLGFGGLSLYYLSLAYLPLADATTIHHTTPLITAVLAWWLLRETIGWSTLVALACGLIGVALVVHPSGSGLDPTGVAVALAATLCAASAYVTVRQLTRTEAALVIVFYFPLIATPLAIPWAAATWVTPEGSEWLLLLGLGLATQVGQVFLTRALVLESASRVTSVGYIQIAFAMIWQAIVFDAPPTVWTLGGAALIVGGTLVVGITSARGRRGAAGSPGRTATSRDTRA